MVLEYMNSPISFHSTHASSDESSETKTNQKYKRISVEKRKLLLDKIFFENKKIKKAAKELNLNYSSAKTILHLYRKKIKKPKIEENSKDAKRSGFAAVNPKIMLKKIEVIATQGGRELKDVFFTQRNISVKPQPEEISQPTTKNADIPLPVKDGRTFVEKFLFYKELERKLSVEEENKVNQFFLIANKVPKIEEKNKVLFRKAIIIKPIDPKFDCLK